MVVIGVVRSMQVHGISLRVHGGLGQRGLRAEEEQRERGSTGLLTCAHQPMVVVNNTYSHAGTDSEGNTREESGARQLASRSWASTCDQPVLSCAAALLLHCAALSQPSVYARV